MPDAAAVTPPTDEQLDPLRADYRKRDRAFMATGLGVLSALLVVAVLVQYVDSEPVGFALIAAGTLVGLVDLLARTLDEARSRPFNTASVILVGLGTLLTTHVPRIGTPLLLLGWLLSVLALRLFHASVWRQRLRLLYPELFADG